MYSIICSLSFFLQRSVCQSRSFSNMSSFRPHDTPTPPEPTSSTKQTGINNLSLPTTFNQQINFLHSNNNNNNNKEHKFNRLPNFRASFHGFSNIPPHQPPPPRLTKIKAPSLPPIALDNENDERTENDGGDDTDSSRKPHYSPERSNSFERFTQTILSDQTNVKLPNNNFNNLNAYSRPRPRLRQIDDDYTPGIDRGTRQYKSKSLYLEVLNRRSFACPVTIDEPVSHLDEEPVITNMQHTQADAAAVLKSQQILRNVSGYATLPRRYKPKPNKK